MSSSKGCAELVTSAYRRSFLQNQGIGLASVRAGNVIGGGDWSENRLIPDCVKSWSKNKRALIRNPKSTRPWQHVLEAVSGYLLLASTLKRNKKLHGEAFNFGPDNTNNYSVIFLVKLIKKYWKVTSWKLSKKRKKGFYESNLLKLNSNKAKIKLKWKCILSFAETISMVADWYKNYYSKPKKMHEISLNQIRKYEKLLKKRSI